MLTRELKAELERLIIEELKASGKSLAPGDLRWRLPLNGKFSEDDVRNACIRLERRGSLHVHMWERGWFRVKHYHYPKNEVS